MRNWLIVHCAAAILFSLLAIMTLLAPPVAAAFTSEDSVWTVDLKRRTLEELMTMDITSVSRWTERLNEASASVQVITNDDLRRSAATTLPEALRLATNLQTAKINSKDWAITARGHNDLIANKLLVLIDGRSVYTPLFSGVFWDVQDVMLDDVDRIEVISGPGAIAWGANAVNGVINVITKRASDPTAQGLLIQNRIGTDVQAQAVARYADKAGDNSFYRIYGKYTSHDDVPTTSGLSGNNSWSLTRGGARIDWNGAADAFTLFADGYAGSAQQYLPADPIASAQDIIMTGGDLIGRWTHTISERSDLQIQAYYDYTYRKIPQIFSEVLHTIDLGFQHQVRFGDQHDFLWGGEYRAGIDHVGGSSYLVFLPPDLNTHLFTGFLQDEISIIPNSLRLLLGSRFEHNSFSGFEFQPTARMSLSLAGRQSLWLAASRAVRTPSRIDRDYFAPGTPPYRVNGGPDIVSEKLYAIELGYRSRPVKEFHVEGTAFYNRYDDIRSFQATPPPPQVRNGLEARTYGFRLTMNIQATEWVGWKVSYTNLQKFVTDKAGYTDLNGTNAEGNDPKHQIHLNTYLDFPGGFEITALLRYMSELPRPTEKVPAYMDGDLVLGWDISPVTYLAVGGRNIFHARHAEYGPNATRFELERGYYAKLTWKPSLK